MRGGGGNRARDRARGITLVKEIRCGVMGFRTIYCLSTKFEHRRRSLLFPLSMGSTLPLSVDTDMKWGEEQTAVVKVHKQPFSPRRTHYSSLRLQWPPLPAKFFSLFAVARSLLPSLSNQLSYTK